MPEVFRGPARQGEDDASVDLYWLPLGAGGRFVRLNGRLYEAAAARLQGRQPFDLYHSALEVSVDPETHVIEVAPAWSSDDPRRGVVAEGPVGLRRAGRLRAFRYEIRSWSGGAIPDVREAVESPLLPPPDPVTAMRLLHCVNACPALVWGRDELGTGEMWNSNSVVSWLLVRSGIDATAITLPAGGRAPGWLAGIEIARAC
jgi:hypothetical protein